jgi:hypothetical protein
LSPSPERELVGIKTERGTVGRSPIHRFHGLEGIKKRSNTNARGQKSIAEKSQNKRSEDNTLPILSRGNNINLPSSEGVHQKPAKKKENQQRLRNNSDFKNISKSSHLAKKRQG